MLLTHLHRRLQAMLVSAVLMIACTHTTSSKPTSTRIFLVGDSTMSAKAATARPETGWGEKLASHLSPNVAIFNHAKNGRSTKSFLEEGRWEAVRSQLQPGDFVFIQFGHNDQKQHKPKRFAPAYGSYQQNLERFIEESRLQGAEPILFSSIARRTFKEDGRLQNTLTPYPKAAQEVAINLNVVFIDLNKLTSMLLESLGNADSQALFLYLAPGAHPNYPLGVNDNTHLNPTGADAVAKLASEALCRSQTRFKNHISSC